MSVRSELADMGFSVSRIEAAIRHIDPVTLESAIDWLEQHPIDSAVEATKFIDGDQGRQDGDDGTIVVDENGEPIETGEVSADAGSLVCDDCGKRFKTAALAEFHATKTQHANFSESVEKIPELSAEQKRAKLDELRVKAAERKAIAAKADQLEQRNNEILRRKADKESSALIEKQKKLQLDKEAADRRRQVKEDAAAKQRIKDLIEADRQSRREKAEREKALRAGVSSPQLSSSSSQSVPSQASRDPSTSQPPQKREYTESRLQIRIDGKSPTIKTFPVETTLFEVAHAVQAVSGISPSHAVFVTTFPTKRYSSEDLGLSLKESGLINTAVMLKQA
ncbi:hypothetical protein V1514DRAFT_351801 [Lipomyces japonicus]|uniref:uncharacterized protein n=1 Tax=Lipomyces japonicus TaxID=56871 RepID=UPI0034CD8505